MRESGAFEALTVAQLLMTASPEFHTNTEPLDKPWEATKLPPQESLRRPYKAIVVIYFAGGADTFNMIVPHSGCDNVTTSYEQYAATRTGAALPLESLRPIQMADGSQPCTTFGLHNKYSYVQQLYQAGEAAITANIGNLKEPIEDKVPASFTNVPRQASLLTAPSVNIIPTAEPPSHHPCSYF